MKKQKKRATSLIPGLNLLDKNLVFQLAKKLKEHLQAKLRQTEGGIYYCSATSPDDWDGCWKEMRRFCSKRGVDFENFIEIIEKYSGAHFDCASDITNNLALEDLARKMGIEGHRI